MSDDSFVLRRRHLRNLVVMAFADGQLGQREVDLFADRCSELDLGEKELTEAISFGLSDDAALELPVDSNDCNETMRDLVRMMAADGVVDEGEKRLFALAAARMNMSVEDIDQLIRDTVDGQ